jgi:hypothetical protein
MARDGCLALLRLVEGGAKVKAAGFGRVGEGLRVAQTLTQIAAVDPGALMLGTDLPGTRAERPFSEADIDLIVETLGGALARRVLRENALELYRRDRRTRG